MIGSPTRRMVEIEIDEQQREALEELRARLAEDHVGEYGHVRYRDVLQYLLDHHAASDSEGGAEETSGTDIDDETEETSTEATDATEDEDVDAGSRLQRMMDLLETHDSEWEETDSEDGKYAVTLPDGSTETVRTKDDIRALLFEHYD